MLKNLSPILSGELLRELDTMELGDTLALLGSDYPVTNEAASLIEVPEVTMEAAADAVFSVMHLDLAVDAPIQAALDESVDEEADAAFAINGIACDAELQRVGMSVVPAAEFAAGVNTASVVLRALSDPRRCAFLLRKG